MTIARAGFNLVKSWMKDVNPSTLRSLREADSFVDDFARANYFEKDSALREANKRAGKRTPANVEKFEELDGSIIRTNPTAKKPGQDTAKYSIYDQSAKDQRNSTVDAARKEDIDLTTEEDATQDFYLNRGKKERKMDAHHLSELDRTAPLFKGLEDYSRRALFKYLRKRGIRPGHVAENRIDFEKKLHQQFHSWFDKKYGRKKFEDAASLPLVKRKKFIDMFIEENQASLEKIYELKNRSALKVTQKDRKGPSKP